MQTPAGDPHERLVALMQAIAAGDRAAFSELYRATAAKLYGIIIRILKRRDLADEILQDVYVKIWQGAREFDRSKGSAIAWMVSIARNRAIDEVRRTTHVSVEDAPETREFASAEPDALSTLASKQDLQRLLACMELLETERREMVLLAYFHGLSREALAARFARPVATVKTWLHRSLAQLKGCVGK